MTNKEALEELKKAVLDIGSIKCNKEMDARTEALKVAVECIEKCVKNKQLYYDIKALVEEQQIEYKTGYFKALYEYREWLSQRSYCEECNGDDCLSCYINAKKKELGQ